MEQVTGIFANTNKIANNTDNINKGVNNIANKLDFNQEPTERYDHSKCRRETQ